MMTLSMSCQSDIMIAIAVDKGDGKAKPHPGSIRFNMIPRHPDWMGMCPAPMDVRGRECVVLESHMNPGRAAVVIATPPGGLIKENMPGTPRPQGQESARLDQLLLHHGASKIEWYNSR